MSVLIVVRASRPHPNNGVPMPLASNGRSKIRSPWARLAIAGAVLAGFSMVARVASAQTRPSDLPQQGAVELPADAKESLQNVTVNDSPEARKDIETARGMERQREWAKAAGWYQEVLAKYHTRVVAWKVDQHNVINSYRGIVYQVQELLAKWPAEGINAYRARYEAAAAAVEAAGADDSNALQAVLDTYFITEAAKIAGLKLIDQHMEAGEFDAAARVGELMLHWYPADHLLVERPRVLFRTALAHHLCGDEIAARTRADELKQKFPEVAGAIFGKDTLLTESLEKLLKIAPALAENLSPDSWTTFSGSPDRAHVSTAQGHMGAKLFSKELPQRPVPASDHRRPQLDDSEDRTIGVMPVVDRGELFYQDGEHIWAIGLDSGNPLPGWTQTYGGKGDYHLKAAASLRSQQHTLTLTDDAVLGVMGQATRLQMINANQGLEPMAGTDAGTRLVCLDRANGRERWQVSPAKLAGDPLKDDEKERIRALDLSGSPLVVGDNVYILGRGGKDFQFENCYVLCFDLNTGQYRWSCLIASSATDFAVYGGDTSQFSSTTSHMAYAGGRLYVLTNLGAVASVDAANGSIAWLSLYEGPQNNDPFIQQGFRNRRFRNRANLNLRPWEYNPVFVRDGKLFFMPTDGKFLLVYNAASGQEIKRMNLDDFQPEGMPDRPNALVGIVGDSIVLTSPRRAYVIDWVRYDPAQAMPLQNNLDLGAASVSVKLGTAARQSGSPSIRGRAFLTADSVYVPTDTNLCRLSIGRRLRILESYPHLQDWDDKEGPGNVIVTGEHVILAGRKSVDVYTDMTLARAKMDREVAAALDDAEPRLHYAELMFAAGQSPVALEKLNEAAALLGGLDSMRSGPARQRLYSAAKAFAEKLAREQDGKSLDAAMQFFDLAGKAADQAAEQVGYRLARAKFVRDNVQPDSYATAVRLYQEILSRPELRTVVVVPESDTQMEARGQVQAAVEAEGQIGDLIRKHPESYEAVGKQAVAALDAAQAAGDAAKLLEVAHTYPNATVASNAMMLAADLYEQAKNPRLAAHVLRQVFRKYGATADKGRIIEAMARNYLNIPGGLDIAVARLQREKLFADTRLTRSLVLPDGSKIEKVTFGEAAEALALARPLESAPPLPDVHVPFLRRPNPLGQDAHKNFLPFFDPGDEAHSLILPDVTALLQPPPEMQEATRGDRIAVTIGNQLAIFAPGHAKPLGISSALTADPREGVWSRTAQGKSSLLTWGGNEILSLDGDTAARLWNSTMKAWPAGELVTAAGMRNTDVAIDSVAADPANNQIDEPQIFINGRGQRVFIGGGVRRNLRGRMGPVVTVGPNAGGDQDALANTPEQISQVRPLEKQVIAATSGGRVVCLDSGTGALLWQTRLSKKPIDRLVASEDFTAVKFTEDGTTKLIVLDNYNGQIQMVRLFQDPNIAPINMAISPDGMLVWTLPDRLCGKDLYEPDSDSSKLTFEDPPRGNGPVVNPIYVNCNKPGQLVIRARDRQIIAMEQGGHWITIHSLETGKPIKHQSDHAEVPSALTTGIPQASNGAPGEVIASFQIVGPYLYTFSPRTVIGYHLNDLGGKSWKSEMGEMSTPNFRLAIPTRDFLMMVGEPAPRKIVEDPARIYQLRFYLRNRPGEHSPFEHGNITHVYDVAEPAGISAWQAVEGGVYYLSGDHRLHFLRGTRE